ncbi:helix-turn-helix transcriptional regulator [Shewanella mangrovi]|nr:AlpA family transcriptional regulator [Shewanella mangrovi]
MDYTNPPAKPRLIRMNEVTQRIGLCKASVYNRINSGDFPKPVSIGGGRVAWLESDIDQWIESRLSAAGHEAA